MERRIKINWDKAKKELISVGDELAKEHGKHGTSESEEFNKKALAYYYGEILKEKRKEKKMTQQELADKIGKQRAYIAKVERGETDLQLSSFTQILNGLGLSLNIV